MASQRVLKLAEQLCLVGGNAGTHWAENWAFLLWTLCVSRSGIKQDSVSLKNSPRSCVSCQCALRGQKMSSVARCKGKMGRGILEGDPVEGE